MSDVVDMDSRRPHIALTDMEGNVHVFPVAMIEAVVAGRMSVDSIDDRDAILRAVLGDWLRSQGS